MRYHSPRSGPQTLLGLRLWNKALGALSGIPSEILLCSHEHSRQSAFTLAHEPFAPFMEKYHPNVPQAASFGSAAYGTAGHPSEWMAESPMTSQHHRHCQQYQIHIPLRSCRIWDCKHESKRATLVWQLFRHSPIVTLICESLPLIRVRPRNPTFTSLIRPESC